MHNCNFPKPEQLLWGNITGKIENQTDLYDTFIDKTQGTDNAGKTFVVGSDGKVTLQNKNFTTYTFSFDESDFSEQDAIFILNTKPITPTEPIAIVGYCIDGDDNIKAILLDGYSTVEDGFECDINLIMSSVSNTASVTVLCWGE